GILGESAATPAADFDVRVRAPNAVKVLSTGAELQPRHFRATAVRDIGLALGPFRVQSMVARGLTIKVASISRPRRSDLALAQRALQRLAARYGAYPW